MSGKQRKLREKRRAEIKSKNLKRFRQSVAAKYGIIKLCYPIRMPSPSMLMSNVITLNGSCGKRRRKHEIDNVSAMINALAAYKLNREALAEKD